MQQPFFMAHDKVESYYTDDHRVYLLEYFNGKEAKTAAERWAAVFGGRVVESSPGSIWRVDRPVTQ